jgi:hypothetical protein
VAALVAALSAGCVSIRMEEATPSPSVYDSGFLEVRVYETMSALKKAEPTRRQILCELYGLEPGPQRPLVHGSSEPVWALSDLPPGRYRLQVVGLVDASGEVRSLGSSDSMDFEVGPGKAVRLSVVLSSGQGLANNVAYGVAWVAVGLLCGTLDEHGVPCSSW